MEGGVSHILKFTLIISVFPSVLLAQMYHPGKVWVTVMDPAIIPLDGVASSNADFNQVLV